MPEVWRAKVSKLRETKDFRALKLMNLKNYTTQKWNMNINTSFGE